MENFDIFCPSGPSMVCIWAKLILVRFYRNFSRYNLEKLIRTLWVWVFCININSGSSCLLMLYKIGVLKNFARFTGNTTVLECIFKFISKFIFKSILQVPSCEICEIFENLFYRTLLDDCFCSRSFDVLFTGMCNIWKVSLLVTVHLILLKLFPIDLLIFFGMFLIVCEMIFRLMIFNTLSHYCYLSSWLPHF